jgi:hypothetical protein
MRSLGVVESPPLLDQDFSFNERVKDFSVEKFVSHASVE